MLPWYCISAMLCDWYRGGFVPTIHQGLWYQIFMADDADWSGNVLSDASNIYKLSVGIWL